MVRNLRRTRGRAYGNRLAPILDVKGTPVSSQYEILVAAETPTLAHDLRTWLGGQGYRVTVVDTYFAAKARLEKRPSLTITELRLGD